MPLKSMSQILRRIQKSKKELDYKEFVKRSALESDFEELVKESSVLIDEEGHIKAIYQELTIPSEHVVEALGKIKYETGQRARGLKSKSRIFGFRPRLAMRADFCSSTSLSHEQPKEHQVVANFARELEAFYAQENPEMFAKHKSIADEKIKDSYRIEGTVFTSGIINKNNPLKYHFDTGNFRDVYSAMVVFKGGIDGGYLSLPEYGVGFELKHNSLFMFDGQSILHGVTPIRYLSPKSFRYSIVYYSLKQIWQCLEIDEELARIRNKKTQREKIRHNMPKEHREFLEKRFGKQ